MGSLGKLITLWRAHIWRSILIWRSRRSHSQALWELRRASMWPQCVRKRMDFRRTDCRFQAHITSNSEWFGFNYLSNLSTIYLFVELFIWQTFYQATFSLWCSPATLFTGTFTLLETICQAEDTLVRHLQWGIFSKVTFKKVSEDAGEEQIIEVKFIF